MRIKFLIILLILTYIYPAYLTANAIIQDDGTIFLGRIKSVDAQTTVINSFGREIQIPTAKMAKNYPTHQPISSLRLNIVLKDGSIISGKIDNYDDEIGLLLDINFGKITIPVAVIQEIYDPEHRISYLGQNKKIGTNLGGYSVLGSLSADFGASFQGDFFGEFITPWRGFFVGIDIAYNYLRYKPDSAIQYSMFSIKPYILYSFLDFKNISSFVKKINPFVGLYGGLAYISKKDTREYAKANSQNSAFPLTAIGLGFDYKILPKYNIRAQTAYNIVMQKTNLFNQLSYQIGVNYAF